MFSKTFLVLTMTILAQNASADPKLACEVYAGDITSILTIRDFSQCDAVSIPMISKALNEELDLADANYQKAANSDVAGNSYKLKVAFAESHLVDVRLALIRLQKVSKSTRN